MSEGFWTIGIIKHSHKRIKNNLWTITYSKKDATHILERITPDIDIRWIVYKFDKRIKSELHILSMLKSITTQKFEYIPLYYENGKFLDNRLQTDSQ